MAVDEKHLTDPVMREALNDLANDPEQESAHAT